MVQDIYDLAMTDIKITAINTPLSLHTHTIVTGTRKDGRYFLKLISV